MVDPGCQDIDRVSGRDKDVLDAIFLGDRFILANLNMEKGKCRYLGCSFGWFRAPRGAPTVAYG